MSIGGSHVTTLGAVTRFYAAFCCVRRSCRLCFLRSSRDHYDKRDSQKKQSKSSRQAVNGSVTLVLWFEKPDRGAESCCRTESVHGPTLSTVNGNKSPTYIWSVSPTFVPAFLTPDAPDVQFWSSQDSQKRKRDRLDRKMSKMVT